MEEIQKAIDEGRLFRPSWGKEYAYTAEELKSLIEQVAKWQREKTFVDVYFNDKSSTSMIQLVTQNLTFKED